MINTTHSNTCQTIDYKKLRGISPPTARKAVLEFYSAQGGSRGAISQTARTFGITRPTVYNIVERGNTGMLEDKSKAPINQPRKTPSDIETKVIEVKNKTRLGPKRLSRYLDKYSGLIVPYGTIRHILRRNKDKIKYNIKGRTRRRFKREFIDWYKAKPFEIVQVDLKHIRDQKALTKEQIIHLDNFNIPNYQWGAVDVNSRFKLISYSREKTWTNGLCWFLWVISWLRTNGVTADIVFTVDNGEEFGGRSWLKVKELRHLISGFGCRLIQNHKGHCEENAHIERSHKTDDDEFYIPKTLDITGEQSLCNWGLKYIYYYNNVREHSSLGNKTPFDYLKEQEPTIDDRIRFAKPFMLDKVSVQLGPWSGYHVLAQYQNLKIFYKFF